MPPADLRAAAARQAANLTHQIPRLETRDSKQPHKRRLQPHRRHQSAPAWRAISIWRAGLHLGHARRATRPGWPWDTMALGSTRRWPVGFSGLPKPPARFPLTIKSRTTRATRRSRKPVCLSALLGSLVNQSSHADLRRFHSVSRQIRSTKCEIRNKFKGPNRPKFKTATHPQGVGGLPTPGRYGQSFWAACGKAKIRSGGAPVGDFRLYKAS